MTDTKTRALAPGDTVHALSSGLAVLLRDSSVSPADIRHLDCGDVFVVTAEMLVANRDRFGRSWLDLIDDPDAQIERWGEVRIGRGPFPSGLDTFVYGSAQWAEERARARAAAEALAEPEERAAAYRAAHERFDVGSPWRPNTTHYRDPSERGSEPADG